MDFFSSPPFYFSHVTRKRDFDELSTGPDFFSRIRKRILSLTGRTAASSRIYEATVMS